MTQTQILAEKCGLAPVLTQYIARSLMIIMIYNYYFYAECTRSVDTQLHVRGSGGAQETLLF